MRTPLACAKAFAIAAAIGPCEASPAPSGPVRVDDPARIHRSAGTRHADLPALAVDLDLGHVGALPP